MNLTTCELLGRVNRKNLKTDLRRPAAGEVAQSPQDDRSWGLGGSSLRVAALQPVLGERAEKFRLLPG